MGVSKDVVEPLVIVLLFTAGSLINRSSQRLPRSSDKINEKLPLYKQTQDWRPSHFISIRPLLSRFLACFPFLIEIWYWNLTYWVYQLARAYSAHAIRGDKETQAIAREHAMQVLDLEKSLHLDIERSFQQYILQRLPALMPVFASIYYAHISVGVCFIVYMYTYVQASLFQKIRRTIATDNAVAFLILTLWRCMPPRFIDGYDDVLHHQTQSIWAENKFRLTIAAMPSLHFGTSAFLGWCVWRFAPKSHKALRMLAPLWPLAMLATILATANHWVLDAMIGVLVPIVGWNVQWLLLHLLPLEDLFFRVLCIDKPVHTDPAGVHSR